MAQTYFLMTLRKCISKKYLTLVHRLMKYKSGELLHGKLGSGRGGQELSGTALSHQVEALETFF